MDYQNTYGNGGAYTVPGSALVAAVHLPDGATVTKFEVFFYDASTADMTVYLDGQHLTDSGYFTVAQVTSSGTRGYYSLSAAASTIIDNTVNVYDVYAISSGWSPSLMIKGAVITYTISEAP